MRTFLFRYLSLVLLGLIGLQIYFALRVFAMQWMDPASTTFERSEIRRVLLGSKPFHWSAQWRDYEQIHPHLARAVIASEDSLFTEHDGVLWEALERAWRRNESSAAKAEAVNARREAQADKTGKPVKLVAPKVVGGSTITQQLAKNLFLDGERQWMRKGQELWITLCLEAFLSKRRILEIYLNHVEWGEGVFGAEAAAQRYFRIPASRLSPAAASRLAVMLPAPRRFEQRPDSPYLQSRSATVMARLNAVDIP